MLDDKRDFDEWACELITTAAKRSTCVRRRAGALAIDDHRRIVSIGYNGVPARFTHCTKEHPCAGAADPPGDTTNCMAIHAEINCIIHAHDPRRIHAMYLTDSPCKNCGLVLANLPNLKMVIYMEDYADSRGLGILRQAGIYIKKIHKK